MNKDRGIIKWMPFNSLIGEQEIINNLLKEKQKVKKPILSLEQQKEIEEKIIEAFYEQIKINIKIYKNGYIKTICSTIINLDIPYKKIYLEHNIILFNQILEVML